MKALDLFTQEEREKREKERFLKKFILSDSTDKCWQWISSTDRDGYGSFRVGKRKVRAHRYSYQLFIGPVDDKWVLHKCDNPSCVNPNHLWLGEALENNRDAIKKGRARFVGRCQKGKLNANYRHGKYICEH